MTRPSIYAAIVLPSVPFGIVYAAWMWRVGCEFEAACGVAGAVIAGVVARFMWSRR